MLRIEATRKTTLLAPPLNFLFVLNIFTNQALLMMFLNEDAKRLVRWTILAPLVLVGLRSARVARLLASTAGLRPNFYETFRLKLPLKLPLTERLQMFLGDDSGDGSHTKPSSFAAR